MPGRGARPQKATHSCGSRFLWALRLRLCELGRFWAQKTPFCRGFRGWRFEADSNRCSDTELSLATGHRTFPQVKITVGLRIYESGFRKVSFFGDKFREDAYNAGDERVMDG